MVKHKKPETNIKAIYKYKRTTSLERPLLGAKVPAGFPSPAQDYIEGTLDLNELLITHPNATFFVKVEGYSMTGAGIQPDDILIVDRSLEARNNKIVIAIVDGELTVKRLKIIDAIYWLVPENPSFESIRIDENIDFIIWGVVTYVIHKV
ncbi:MAG TPA: translesion error-prone DNA polymerase V autoproteolytic subunit [Candidatus Cloacimonadota bacterium]|nr:translesion error-prone DNA polymerase V autoproteolytic subunit [Candidatus Cloacimonadota bacterium]HOV17152.1 translesion error-prone DNA polymerase V autoproteolytic subunit [Candidatus Cloacimonadota bacterium]HQL15496.1 translesion error-prone DNA polymerase V autoproteolytic subunit [Candidatus Cloacimonadota bacterium]